MGVQYSDPHCIVTRTVPSLTASGLIQPKIVSCFGEGVASFEEGNNCMNDKPFISLVNIGLPIKPAGVYNGSYEIQDSLPGILLPLISVDPRSLLKGQSPAGAGK